MGTIHGTHAAAIDQRKNFVRTESSAGLERHAMTERIIELNRDGLRPARSPAWRSALRHPSSRRVAEMRRSGE